MYSRNTHAGSFSPHSLNDILSVNAQMPLGSRITPLLPEVTDPTQFGLAALRQTLHRASIGFKPALGESFRFPIFPTLVWPLTTRAAERKASSKSGETLVHRSISRGFVGIPHGVFERARVTQADLEARDLPASELNRYVRLVQRNLPGFLLGGSAALVLAPTQNPNWNAGNSYRFITWGLGQAAKLPLEALSQGWNEGDLARTQPTIQVPANAAKYLIWDKGKTPKGGYQAQQQRILDEITRMPSIHILGRDWSPTQDGCWDFELPANLFSVERPTHFPIEPLIPLAGRPAREAIRVRLTATGCVFAFTLGRRLCDLAGCSVSNYDSFLIGKAMDWWFRLPEAEGRLAMHLLMSPGNRRQSGAGRDYSYLAKDYTDSYGTGMEYLSMALGRSLPFLPEAPEGEASLPVKERLEASRKRQQAYLKAGRDWRYQFPKSVGSIIKGLQESIGSLSGISERLTRHLYEAMGDFCDSYGQPNHLEYLSGITADDSTDPLPLGSGPEIDEDDFAQIQPSTHAEKHQNGVQVSLFENLDGLTADGSTVAPEFDELQQTARRITADGSTGYSRRLDELQQTARRQNDLSLDSATNDLALSSFQSLASINQSVRPSVEPSAPVTEVTEGTTDGTRADGRDVVSSAGFSFQSGGIATSAVFSFSSGVVPVVPSASMTPSKSRTLDSQSEKPLKEESSTLQQEKAKAEPSTLTPGKGNDLADLPFLSTLDEGHSTSRSFDGQPVEESTSDPVIDLSDASALRAYEARGLSDQELWDRIIPQIVAWIGDEGAEYQTTKIRERTPLTPAEVWVMFEAIRVGTKGWSQRGKATGALLRAMGAKPGMTDQDHRDALAGWAQARREVLGKLQAAGWVEEATDGTPLAPASRQKANLGPYRRLPLDPGGRKRHEAILANIRKAYEETRVRSEQGAREAARSREDLPSVAKDKSEAARLWHQIVEALDASSLTMANWISPCRAVGFDGTTLWIEAPTAATRVWIEQQLAEDLHEAMVAAEIGNLRLAFTART